jgi:hypothetical protein
MAKFFQDTLSELIKEQKRKASKKKQELLEAGELGDDGAATISETVDSAASMLDFLEKARNGTKADPSFRAFCPRRR